VDRSGVRCEGPPGALREGSDECTPVTYLTVKTLEQALAEAVAQNRLPENHDGLRLGRRYVRLTAVEKAEGSPGSAGIQTGRPVEDSDLSARRTLAEPGVHPSTLDASYRRYPEDGVAGLAEKMLMDGPPPIPGGRQRLPIVRSGSEACGQSVDVPASSCLFCIRSVRQARTMPPPESSGSQATVATPSTAAGIAVIDRRAR
jgi:hypothetical protein